MQSLKRKDGQGLIEYILIVGLMGILAIVAIHELGNQTRKGFTKASSKLSSEFSRF